ncbi:hypothetical protein [Natrinema pallidum]|uniref:DUF8119 domain-containing protein n=2 Tax=Natrinema pallidum TaxID=69527 RepID=L9YJY6_9EURY|nr:hypothetical protein [Natrinema pallidum]ELY74470.1 hypothetical protein C487_14949 [Natrinema pallidum DSM 3751]QCW03918.1 hypothetical protein FGF80_12000 [Natrinema pallidum]
MSVIDRVREHIADNGTGMIYDLLFAVVWVALVRFLFDFVFVDAPRWAFYMFMLAGIVAYFGFFFSLEQVTRQ